MSKIGRNDPCPCGSNKKYKKCCLEADLQSAAQANLAKSANQELSKAFAGQQFESVDDMQVFADHKVQQMNATPREELGGFSPNQLRTLLHQPLDRQELIRWRATIASEALTASPIWVVFQALKAYLAEHKAKATARGNFPRAVVKYVLAIYLEQFGSKFTLERVNKEEDFRELHIAHLVFEMAGLLKLYKGHFTLTQKAHTLSDSDLFKRMFTTYIEEYNWAYEDCIAELAFVQEAAVYSLVTLNRLKGQSIDKQEFAEDFVRVFPMLLDEVEARPYQKPLDIITHCYSVRTISRCWQYFGFATLQGERFTKNYEKTLVPMPLLQEVFEFPQR